MEECMAFRLCDEAHTLRIPSSTPDWSIRLMKGDHLIYSSGTAIHSDTRDLELPIKTARNLLGPNSVPLSPRPYDPYAPGSDSPVDAEPGVVHSLGGPIPILRPICSPYRPGDTRKLHDSPHNCHAH